MGSVSSVNPKASFLGVYKCHLAGSSRPKQAKKIVICDAMRILCNFSDFLMEKRHNCQPKDGYLLLSFALIALLSKNRTFYA